MQMFKWRSLLSPFPLQLSWASFSGWMEWGDGGGGGEKNLSARLHMNKLHCFGRPSLHACLLLSFGLSILSV